MCGVCGFIDYQSQSDVEVLSKMVLALYHRGPDDSGQEFYTCSHAMVGIGHSRLSVIDLSDAAHQPMKYRHLIISYNGEIYNYREIRDELAALGHTFVSRSDTEVVLHAFDEWGISSISKFIGMFAFAIFNNRDLKITFVRDRAGVKPFYYYWDNKLLLFASELKALCQHPNFQRLVNLNSVYQYFDFGYIPSPNCIFENCSKLEPGHLLQFDIIRKKLEIVKYWDIRDFYFKPSLKITYSEAKQELEKLLSSAFEYRMVSDVPVGIFLSGGYDSTAVTSILQSNRTRKLKTFTIGFHEGNNEAPYAQEIAKYLGTDHTEYYCETREAQEIIDSLPYYFDEPFADSSAIPTILVSKLAKKSVTVALSADAGDELFAGYKNYKTFLDNLTLIRRIPTFSRGLVSVLSRFAGSMNFSNEFLKQKFQVLADVLNSDHGKVPQSLWSSYYSLNGGIKERLFRYKAENRPSVYEEDFSSFKDSLSAALATDYLMYLQNDILTKVDRSTMSVSLEGRDPFLDHRLAEFVAQLPSEFKFGKTQKMILKDIVYEYVPKDMMDRPKSGFSVPIDSWFRDDLSSLVEDYLSPQAIARTDMFNYPYVHQLKQGLTNGKNSNAVFLWKLIQFQMWYTKWLL